MARSGGSEQLKAKMQAWLFGSFLMVFNLTAILTLLALFFDFGKLGDSERKALMGATLLEIAAAVVALFYSVFRLAKRSRQGEVVVATKQSRTALVLAVVAVFVAGATTAAMLTRANHVSLRAIARQMAQSHFAETRAKVDRFLYESYLPFVLERAHESSNLDAALRAALSGQSALTTKDVVEVYVEEAVKVTSAFRAELVEPIDEMEDSVLVAIDAGNAGTLDHLRSRLEGLVVGLDHRLANPVGSTAGK